MPTTFGSLKTTGTLVVAGIATFALGVTFSGAITGTSGTFSSTVTVVSTISGAQITATPTSGTAAVVLYGPAKGSHLCVRDTDGTGWSECDTLNGTMTCRIASAASCP